MATILSNDARTAAGLPSKVRVGKTVKNATRSATNGKLLVLQKTSEPVGRLIPVIAHAVAVFGDEHKASHWLKTPLALLDNHSPSQLLVTSAGVKRVEQILTRIEHNIPS